MIVCHFSFIIILRKKLCFVGGLEGVIVVWQLDTGKRKYKPRLGSPLLFFVDSPDSSISCVSSFHLVLVSDTFFLCRDKLLMIYEVSRICIPSCYSSIYCVGKWKFSDSCFSLAQNYVTN